MVAIEEARGTADWCRVEHDVALAVHELNTSFERPLLVLHGGPDWDHSYLREPLCRREANVDYCF